MHPFNELNQKISALNQTNSSDPFAQLESVVSLVREVLAILGIGNESFGTPQLLTLPRIQSELTKFMNAPGFRKQAAAYELPNKSNLPLDIKLFWIKKASKSNLSWSVGVTSNYEDSPENYANKNIGIDFVVPEKADRVFVILSSKLRLRVLELHERLTHTQREIFTQWASLAKLENSDPLLFKENLHARLWKSFDYEPVNREFYKELVERFDMLVEALTKQGTSDSDAKMFSVRLIGRLLFLWFLRKKEFLNPELHYFNAGEGMDQSEYYYSKLEPLFFEVLNAEMKDRTFADKITPFLNGGLFEPIAVDLHSKENKKFVFPKAFFANFYDRLDHYNFTVDEGTSEYEQVAIDPEMLGRVFENLLASLHTETGKQARKAKGAFYTPREIVDYMCAESLIEYLKTKLPDTENRDIRIRELVTMSESDFRGQDHNKRRDFEAALGRQATVDALNELRILDPAVGSGAFPMGMLQLLVKVYGRLDAKLEKNLSILKRDILSRSLYGVDIDQMAIQISRLRAWLSILVDMEELKKVAPLPNLDFKFVCANTLIPLSTETGLFDHTSKDELTALRDEYYNATRKSEKQKIRKTYTEKIHNAGGNLFGSAQEKQLAEYDPFNPLTSASFYDQSLMHGVEAFDVVIGNPPYVQIQKFARTQMQKDLENVGYEVFARTGDLYALFYERGLELSKKDTGILCYITSNKWMRAGYGEKLRAYFAKKNPLTLIDLGSGVFESATVDSNILLIQNGENNSLTNAVTIHGKVDLNVLSFTQIAFTTSGPWSIGTDVEQKLKEKIEKIGKPLKDWDVKIYRGILTGLNEAFIIDKTKRDELIAEDPKSAEIIKPILRGRDIKRYGYQQNGLYLLMTGFDTDVPSKYPAIFKYLQQYESQAKKRQDQGMNWWNLRACAYYDEFEKEKIVWQEMAQDPSFAYSDSEIYCNDTCRIITGEKNKFLIGVFNSIFFKFTFANYYAGGGLGEKGIRYKGDFMKLFPIPALNVDIENNITELVSEITKLKKQDPKTSTTDLESQIDHLIYQLYNLTPEEREIIEKTT